MRENSHINACISDKIWRQFTTYGGGGSTYPEPDIFLFFWD